MHINGNLRLTHLLTIVAALLIGISGCSKKNPVASDAQDNDVILSKLLGYSYSFPSGSIVFRPDYTFTDSTYYRSSADTTKYILESVFEGKFALTNAILQYVSVHVVYLDTVYYRGLGEIIWPAESELSLVNNRLVFTPVKVFTLVQGSGSELWGTWSKTACVYMCGSNPRQVVYEGRQKYTYTFKKDSADFTYGWTYLDGQPYPNYTFTSNFTYSPPALSLPGPSDYISRVEFKNGTMYWYYDFPSSTVKPERCIRFAPLDR